MTIPWKDIFTQWKVVLLLIIIVLSFVAIQPQFFGNEGVTIRSVAPNSSAAIAGISNPSPKLTPLAKEKIISLDGMKVASLSEYQGALSTLKENRTVKLETNRAIYTLMTKGHEGTVDLGLKVYPTPTSNLRKGLDLEGGTRVLLKPAEPVSEETLTITIENLQERLNVYGLSDIVVRQASDLSGEDFILIEIAGVTEEEIKELLAKQGKFEAQIANETVFYGGEKDITYVCRSADCSGIDPRRACGRVESGYACSFFFTIAVSPEAAERQAAITDRLSVVSENGEQFLSEDLVLYLDDKQVDNLRIGADLKGRATTSIQISGSGTGKTEQEAVTNTLQNMKRLQTVLITGSLPVQLNIVKLDTISPTLGQEFLNNVVLVGVLAVLAVVVVIFIRYRQLKVVIPIALTLIAEMFCILGFAAFVGWNLDLAAIAGIIIVAGTGVDHLVVITDETLRGEVITDWKRKIKAALFIIMGAYLTVLSGMLPLLWAGAGLLKGFALTTIAGLSFGVLVARPAYAAILEKLVQNK